MTGSDDQQFVITLVTVVNSSSIPFRDRDRALQVMSDEKKRVSSFLVGIRI